MNIVRWLTNHPILSVWALTIVALLLSLGGTGGKKHDADVASNEPVEVEATAHHADGEKADHSHEVADASHQVQDAAPANNTVVNNNTVTDVSQQEQVAVPAVPSPVNNAPVSTTGAGISGTEVVATAPAVEVAPTNASSTEQKIIASDLNDKSVDDLLLMAREAYWNNGLDEAANIYQQLIQREPNVVEHKGELGNVYWRQGFPEKSAGLYADIAIPMIDKGNAERVSNMIGFIGLFHPDKAAEINKHMQSAASNK